MEHTQFEEALTQAGPGIPTVAEIRKLGDEGWLVLADDGAQVMIERGGPTGGIGLSATLGHPGVDRRFVVYEAMLAFNALARQNGGARIGLHGDGEEAAELVMELDMAARAYTAAELEDLLTRFMGAARQWRDYVALEPERVELLPLSMMLALRA